MFDFTPTLELVISTADVAEAVAHDTTIEEAAVNMADTFKEKSKLIHAGMSFTAENIRIVGTEIIITDFNATVVAVFDVDGVTYLKLATGDVIAIQFIVVD